MILRFNVDPQALKDVDERGGWGTFLHALENFWLTHGVWIIPDDLDQSLQNSGLADQRIADWKKFVTNNAFRKRWLHSDVGSFDWHKVRSWIEVANWDKVIDLALVGDTCAQHFNLADDDPPCAHDQHDRTHIEIARGRNVSLTCNVQDFVKLADSAVSSAELPDEVWAKRFCQHMAYSTSVTLVDKWAARHNNRPLLFYVLSKMLTSGWRDTHRAQCVNIYSTYASFSGNGPDGARTIQDRIEKWAQICLGSLGATIPSVNINVHLLDWRDVQHDRWARFDHNFLELGQGLTVFETIRSGGLGFRLKGRDDTRQKDEQDLNAICSPVNTAGGPSIRVLVHAKAKV